MAKKEHNEIAESLMKQYPFKTPDDSKIVYVYRNGFYSDGKLLIEIETQKIMDENGDKVSNNFVDEVIGVIRRKTIISREEADKYKHLISLKNGLYDLDKMELMLHNPDFFITYQIPVNYNPEKRCPAILKFFSEIVSGQDVETLIQIIGYCLYKGYPFKVFFILLGERDTGKSTFCNLLTAFLGSDNVSAIPIQDLQHRFRSVGLVDKLANVVADLPTKAIKDVGMIKQLTGNDLIGAEYKYGAPFQFRNHAKLVFATNELPWISPYTDEAFYERIKFVLFPNRFDQSNRDIDLLDKLTTDDELSGLLNIALNELWMMLTDKEFYHCNTADENRKMWESAIRADSVTKFLKSHVVVKSHTVQVEKETLFKAHVEWCLENAEIPVSKSKFGRVMKACGYGEFMPAGGNRQVHAWKGISIRQP